MNMTQEEKELLLKDICSRVPYGLVLDVDTEDWKAPQGHIQLKIEGIGILFKDMSLVVNGFYYGDNYRPYLRPMSSMTEEEMEKYKTISIWGWVRESKVGMTDICPTIEGYDWLNAHHFDYRRLIEKGLAIEAPKGMYEEKTS